MTGFSFFLLLPAWIAACAFVAHKIGDLFTGNPLRAELKAVIFLALLPLLLIDELIAKSQFDQLCASKAVLTVHSTQTQGRSAYLTELPAEPVPGVLVPVQMQRRVYLDARTHEPVVSFSVLSAEAGKLARVVGRDAARPLSFEGECGPPDWAASVQALGLDIVARERPGESPGR